LHIHEVVGAKPTKPKKSKKTDWEKNMTRLQGKERKLDAQKPVKPVTTD
jgi:hypothetical protein